MTDTRNQALRDAALLRKWAEVLDIPSGNFVNEDLLGAAKTLEALAMQEPVAPQEAQSATSEPAPDASQTAQSATSAPSCCGADAIKSVADWLDESPCCQEHGGPGCHPSRCGDCPRDKADLLRAMIAAAQEGE